jgi:P-type conjugative transfer protein TrbJ
MTFSMKRICSLAVFSATVLSAPAQAQWAVIDPTNLVQNTASAAAAVRNEVNTYNGLIQQIKSAIHLANSTASLKDLNGLAGVVDELRHFQNLKDTDTELSKSINQSLALSKDVLSLYGSSQYSWTSFLASKNSYEVAKGKALEKQYNILTAFIEDTATRRKNIITQMQMSKGATEATQAVGAGIDVLIGQNQQMLAALAIKTKLDATSDAQPSMTENQAIKEFNDYQKRLREAAGKY